MGGKKKAIMIFRGSTKVHWIRYITNLNMDVNPTSLTAMGTSFRMLNLLNSIDTKYLQPGFQYKFDISQNASYNAPSLLHLKFVNGYEKKFDIDASEMTAIRAQIDEINHYVEFERSMAGQDDELDDEA